MWTLAVSRSEPSRTELVEGPEPAVADGEALLRVDRVGLTTNNATYAALGEALHYWRFFPAPRPELGVVPVWGFATVVAGPGTGTRVYGYLPMASHLLVRPSGLDGRGFRDAAPHRAELPPVYNSYAAADADPVYAPHTEDLQVLYRPLFTTAFVLADQLVADGFDGASTVVLSSASSRTAHGTAFLLRGTGARLVGLTSDVPYCQALGVYDEVLPYGSEGAVPGTAVHLDVAGSARVTGALRDALGPALVREWIVGLASQPAGRGAPPLPDGRTGVFFAPDRIRARTAEWGRDGFESRLAEAWARFLPAAPDRVEVGAGPAALAAAWTSLLTDPPAPGRARVVTFG